MGIVVSLFITCINQTGYSIPFAKRWWSIFCSFNPFFYSLSQAVKAKDYLYDIKTTLIL